MLNDSSRKILNLKSGHCVESDHIRNYSGTRITPNTDTFHAVGMWTVVKNIYLAYKKSSYTFKFCTSVGVNL